MDKKYINEDATIINTYFKDIKDHKLLTPEEEVALAKRISENDESAVKELVEANLRFVISIAKKYQDNGVSLNDLISEGNFGLVKAARLFDHTRGFRFISYAVWWIKQSILQYLNESSRTIRLPVNILSKIYNLKKELNTHEVCGDEMLLDDKDLELLNKYPKCSSTNFLINEDGDELGNVLESEPITYFDEMHEDELELRSDINDCLDILEEREKEILIYYYGLSDSDENWTLEAIGEKYGLTKERVRQIKGKAIQKLRANFLSIIKLQD